ncbi:Pyruvate dehydrogenase phosphatase regulatory subunit, mitochondrial [Portunus trituberculatus]|uniref:Pyruvate dehydrogenase phosphatase regulatory subunit, mitochondrial n=1 Tax=Portunus trituberculatus TaxID=210409 RepID=A0A5B7K7F7_PORTR|nr:Pyruvate dehydrogenase phosphatase regulatory subunit, mitochondrial [Portunus trituberculatus]
MKKQTIQNRNLLFQYAVHVYENLVSVGKKYNMLHAGYYAMRSLRIEKFYAFWGQDLDSTTTPLECGRGFRVKLNVSISLLCLLTSCVDII